ncbi:MAG TPA: ABC transporter permease, partial [Anaerolineae bacterium]|nr:ABC transporter permease [Anaerolineae bacterium]
GAGNIEYLSKLNADVIVYQENSQQSISASRLNRSKLNDVARIEGVEAVGPIGASSATIVLPDGVANAKPIDVSLLGVEPGKPGDVPIREGQTFSSRRANEVVVDRNTAFRAKLKPGDSVTLKTVQGTNEEFYTLQVVGISDGQQFFLRPSVFVPDITWDKIRPKGGEPDTGELAYNIFAVKLSDPAQVKAMQQIIPQRVERVETADISTAYKKTPGYAEQQSTLDTQRIFTLIIGVLVIGGFFQIQTLQKVPQIGMLKAIGARNRTVALASIFQVTLVTIIGVAIGAAFTLLLAANFPVTVPIVFTPNTTMIAIVSLLLIGPIGGLVSVRYSLRIEPLRALGLG